MENMELSRTTTYYFTLKKKYGVEPLCFPLLTYDSVIWHLTKELEKKVREEKGMERKNVRWCMER